MQSILIGFNILFDDELQRLILLIGCFVSTRYLEIILEVSRKSFRLINSCSQSFSGNPLDFGEQLLRLGYCLNVHNKISFERQTDIEESQQYL